MSNLKSVVLAVMQLFAFNAQKFMGLCDPSHTPLFKKFLRGHVPTVSWSMHANFEVRSFSILEHLMPKNVGGYVTLARPFFEALPSFDIQGWWPPTYDV